MGSAYEDLFEGVMWNSSARIERDEETKELVPRGNVTEQGLYKFFMNVKTAEGCIAKKNELTEDN